MRNLALWILSRDTPVLKKGNSKVCYAIYIASDAILPTSRWDENNPQFYVSDAQEVEEKVAKLFSKPHIYFVGSHTHCSCGFFYGPDWAYDEDGKDDLQQETDSARKLVSYLDSALEKTDELELFVSWEGDQHEFSVKKKEISPQALIGDEFPLDEGDFAIIKRESPKPNV